MTEAADPGLYADYAAWKGWDTPFACPADQARYFSAELRGFTMSGARVLEIGFGNGEFLGWARSAGASITGSELTPASVAAAEAAGIPLIPPDFENGDLVEGTFDLIVAFDVFEHLDVPTIRAKLAACARMLTSGGWLVLRFPNGQSPFGLIPQHGDATHMTALSCAKIEQYARGTGLVTRRYGSAATADADTVVKTLARRLRAGLRRIHMRAIQFLYASDVPLDPVVTLILAKPAASL